MNITSLSYASAPEMIEKAKQLTFGITNPTGEAPVKGGFESLLDTAIQNFNITNSYQSDKEDMELKWAMGEVDNPHDLTTALSKATQSLNYTVAIRDRLLEAYREIMQLQI